MAVVASLFATLLLLSLLKRPQIARHQDGILSFGRLQLPRQRQNLLPKLRVFPPLVWISRLGHLIEHSLLRV